MLKKAILLLAFVLTAFAGVIAAEEMADKVKATEPADEVTVETAVCTGVEEREPVGEADVFPSDVNQVYLWSKVTGIQDTTMIKHVWYYKGEEITSVQLPVKSSSWRTYSYKTIPAEWSGDWVVKVVDASGNVLKAVPFKVGEEKLSSTE